MSGLDAEARRWSIGLIRRAWVFTGETESKANWADLHEVIMAVPEEDRTSVIAGLAIAIGCTMHMIGFTEAKAEEFLSKLLVEVEAEEE